MKEMYVFVFYIYGFGFLIWMNLFNQTSHGVAFSEWVNVFTHLCWRWHFLVANLFEMTSDCQNYIQRMLLCYVQR